jgi:osmotically-inducible protein OsmY
MKVEHGVVMLTGNVEHQFQKQAAERDIRRLGGVTNIINRIDVRLDAYQTTDPATVHEKIENALRRSVEFDATHIGVSISGHKATLRGKVRSWWERRAAESAAWSAPGVTEVDNQLVIGN